MNDRPIASLVRLMSVYQNNESDRDFTATCSGIPLMLAGDCGYEAVWGTIRLIQQDSYYVHTVSATLSH